MNSIFIENFSKIDTEAKFADWLWEVLTDLYQPNGKKMQSELYRFMTREGLDSSTDALEAIYYRYLCDSDMRLFCKAINSVFHRCAEKPEKEIFHITNDLIYLLGRVYKGHAVYALDGLLAVLSKEQVAKNHPRLLYNCLTIIQTLELSDEVYNFVKNLAQNPHFDDGFIFSVIKIMTDHKPDNSIEIVEGFSQRISNLYNKAKEKSPAEESIYWEEVSDLFTKDSDVMNKILIYSK